MGAAIGAVRCPFIHRKRAASEFLFLQGEPAARVFFVRSGAVLLTHTDDSGQESAHALRRSGSFVGLEALVRPTYADSARMLTAGLICAAPREAVDAWLGPRELPARLALEQVVAAAAEDVPRAASPDGTAARRVARWLIGNEDQEVRLPRTVVADLLGMKPETLSRALAALARAQLIELSRSFVRVRDREQLRRLVAT